MATQPPFVHPGSARRSTDSVENAGQQLSRTGSGTAPLPATPARTGASQQLVALSTRLLLARPAKLSEAGSLPLGAVVTPALPPETAASGRTDVAEPAPSTGLPTLLGTPVRCTNCGAFQNCYCPTSTSSGEWHCCFCLHLNTSGVPGVASGKSASAMTEAVDWMDPAAEGSSARGDTGGLLALLVDVAAEAGEVEVAKAALLRALYGLHGSTHVALLAFAQRGVMAYRLTLQTAEQLSPRQAAAGADAVPLVEADALPGDAYVSDAVLAALRPGVHTQELRQCRQQLVAAISSLRSHSPGGNGRSSSKPRCLGAALEAALHLAVNQAQQGTGAAAQQPQQQEMSKGEVGRPQAHVVVVTAGHAVAYTVGLEAEEGGRDGREDAVQHAEAATTYFDEVARVAAGQGVTLDIVAASDSSRQLAPLSQATGGVFALHAPPAPRSLREDAADQEGSSNSSSSFAASISAAVVRPAGLGCLMEVHTSSGLTVTDAYGAVLPICLNGQPTDEWYEQMGGKQQLPSHWAHSRLSVYRTGKVCFRWTDADGSSMARLITRRLATTKNPAAAVEALDPVVAGIVWAKSVVASALERGAATDRRVSEILKRLTAEQLSEFAAAYLLPDETSRGWLSGPSRFLLPATFMPLAAALHQLVRGPLLSHAALASADARELLQAHFMTSSLAQSRLALLPQMHLLLPFDATTSMQAGAPFLPPAPAADLLLLPKAAAVVDAGAEILVWVHIKASRVQQEACMALAQSLAAGRMPAPDIAVVSSGSAAERQKLFPRLMLLGDARKRLRHEVLPLMLSLPPDEAAAAADAAHAWLHESGVLSLGQWLRQLGVLPLVQAAALRDI